VLLESNAKTAEEYYSMNENRVTLKQVVERLGLTKEWEARGIAIGEARAKAEARAEVAAELERLRREVARLKARA
jgi:primosomal protein N''